MDFEQARFNMVEQQIRTWEVLDQEVLDLLYVVPREEFVPEQHRALAFSDLEIPLEEGAKAGSGECMWQPKLEARVLQELTIKRSDRVLEVGTGSGYLTALMAHRAAQVCSVEQAGEGVTLSAQRHGGQQRYTAEKLLIATGRRPNTRELGLEQAGVGVDATGAVLVDRTLRTSVAHIWAAGDVIGRETGSQMATPVGAHDGKIAAHNALAGEPLREVDHSVIPRTIFTDPQVAVVGLTDEDGVGCKRRPVCGEAWRARTLAVAGDGD